MGHSACGFVTERAKSKAGARIIKGRPFVDLALETRTSGDYQVPGGELRRQHKPGYIRGLNLNHNPDLKSIFKGAATTASTRPGPLASFTKTFRLRV